MSFRPRDSGAGTPSSVWTSIRDTSSSMTARTEREVCFTPTAARGLAGVAAMVVVLVGAWPNHPLHREAAAVEIAVGGDLYCLEVLEQRRAVVPGHVLRAVDDVVALQCGDGDRDQVGQPERAELRGDPVQP